MNGTRIYLDTHVVAWLFQRGAAALSAAGVEAVRSADELRISPIVRLELHYLHEIGRMKDSSADILDALASMGLSICDAAFPAVAREAERHGWTRDPFDRLIVAQASLRAAPLITKDATIHRHYPAALW